MSATAEVIEERRIYTSAEVARLVFHKTGRQIDWFYTNKARLIAQEGFPRPISKFGWPRWYGKDLLDWLARPKIPSGEQGDGRNVVDFSGILRQRARAIARRT